MQKNSMGTKDQSSGYTWWNFLLKWIKFSFSCFQRLKSRTNVILVHCTAFTLCNVIRVQNGFFIVIKYAWKYLSWRGHWFCHIIHICREKKFRVFQTVDNFTKGRLRTKDAFEKRLLWQLIHSVGRRLVSLQRKDLRRCDRIFWRKSGFFKFLEKEKVFKPIDYKWAAVLWLSKKVSD